MNLAVGSPLKPKWVEILPPTALEAEKKLLTCICNHCCKPSEFRCNSSSFRICCDKSGMFSCSFPQFQGLYYECDVYGSMLVTPCSNSALPSVATLMLLSYFRTHKTQATVVTSQPTYRCFLCRH